MLGDIGGVGIGGSDHCSAPTTVTTAILTKALTIHTNELVSYGSKLIETRQGRPP